MIMTTPDAALDSKIDESNGADKNNSAHTRRNEIGTHDSVTPS